MLRRLLLLIVFLVAPAAWAADGQGVVREIVAPDAAGRWQSTNHSTRAAVLHDGVRVPLTVGLVLRLGDRVVTDDARVTIDLGDGEELRVGEHADVEVRERTAIQRLGDVYYHVRSAFTVEYGTVQTAVEGTRFVVLDGAEVRVVEGRVRVTTPNGTARLGRWGTAGPDGAAHWRPLATAAAVTRSFPRGAPRFELGLAGVGGWDDGAFGGIRLSGRFRITGPLRLAIESGVGTGGVDVRMPRAFGAELALGALRVGAGAMGTLELGRLGCSGTWLALHLGGGATVGTILPLTRRTSITMQARFGWVDGPLAEGAVGVAAAW